MRVFWSILWTAHWAIKIVITVMIGGFVTAMVFATLLGVTNEAWIAIGTAAYATFAFLTVLVLAIAATLALRQLQQADQERRLRIHLELSTRWDSQMLRRGRRLVNKAGKNLKRDLSKYEANDDKRFYIILAVGNFFEDVGIVTLKRRLWSVEEARERMGASIQYYYGLFADYIEAAQKEDRSILENFSNIAAEIRKLEVCGDATSSP